MEQTKIREQVIDDLKQYPELKKKVILLRYEQEHPAKISDSEVIDSMALSRPVSDGIRPAGFISDKTMRIATQFRDKKDRLNQETIMKTENPAISRPKRSRCRSSQVIIDSPTPFSALYDCLWTKPNAHQRAQYNSISAHHKKVPSSVHFL